MMDLIYYRPDYVIAGEGSSEQRLADAHRTLRTALAIGEVLLPSTDLCERVARAIETVEGAPDDERRYEQADVSALAALASEVATGLDEAIDEDQRPRGTGGERIQREAADFRELIGKQSDPHQVFVRHEDGRIGLAPPRMNLYDFRDELPALIDFLTVAAARGEPVVVDG
jgi:hypothetical protein